MVDTPARPDDASPSPEGEPGRSLPALLAGKKTLVTGVTGFLGQAVAERLLHDFPDTPLVVLIRPQHGVSGRSRLEKVMKRPLFDRLREREGGDDGISRLLDRRVLVVEGDFTREAPSFPNDLDLVIHCAAAVSFDPPIDEGFQTNLLGTQRFYGSIVASGSTPHLVHVSTAYVAGTQKGVIFERTLDHKVDWRAEADFALQARRDVEAASRRPEQLDSFMDEARKEHSRAGPQTVATDAEQRRKDWATKRLIHYGRARAQTLGWPDNYTFTKAMGERATEELAAEHDLPLSIVRPSIIESAYTHPFPGWIEGFKMAEPIILAYGQGQITEFPGIPEGIVDIIPADLVVNTILAVAANPPPDEPGYYHASSGDRNPLMYYELYEWVREYFEAHPLPERGRGYVKPPTWTFPGNLKVERMLRTGERLVDIADTAVRRLPKSKRTRDLIARVDRDKSRVEFVRRYADLYGTYTEAEVIYTDTNTLRLFDSLTDQDKARFPFDSAIVDWKYYLIDVHCPSVTSSLRKLSSKKRTPSVQIREREEPTLAVFDMEGTIISSNVVESYVWTKMADLEWMDWPKELVDVFGRVPGYLMADRRDRGEFLRTFFRRYEGASVEGVQEIIDDHVGEFMLQKASPAAIRRIREHRAAGHRTLLLTAAAEIFIQPLAPLFDVMVGAELAERDGRYTGFMATPPLVGEARAAWLRRYAADHGVDLKQCYGYADSHSDLPLLRAVGNPVAVSPDSALLRIARKRRWPVEEWAMSTPMPRVRFPKPAIR
ncbi:MAG: HAD-IB family hydrolase [Actinomycetota bacterium]